MSAEQDSFTDKAKKILKMKVTTNEREPIETPEPVKETRSGDLNDVKEKFFNLFKKSALPSSKEVKDPDAEETKNPSKGSAETGSGDLSEKKKEFFRLPKFFKKKKTAPLHEIIRTSDSGKETIVKSSEPISVNDERFQLESGIKRDFDVSSTPDPEEKGDLTDASTKKLFEKVNNSSDMSLIPGRVILALFG